MLEDANQSTGTTEWEPQARGGVYLVHSPFHSVNVALILNLQTSRVSPQYHVVYGDEFTAVKYIKSEKEPPNWCKLVEDSSEKVTDEQYNLARTWYASETKNYYHQVHDDTLIGVNMEMK